MNDRRHSVLVIGATGTQGSAAVRELLRRGHRVRALTRDPARARGLSRLGADLVRGDLADRHSIEAALRGATAVFAVPLRDPTDEKGELKNSILLAEAAKRAGVQHYIQTSVAGTGDLPHMPRWNSGYWNEDYWETKWRIEETIRHTGFPAHTILKPAFLMENFASPKVASMFPELPHGEIVTAIGAQTRVQLIAADDIAAFGAAALDQPGRFSERSIELAAEALTMREIAATLGVVTGRPVAAISLTSREALAAGRHPAVVRGEEWLNEVGYHAPIDTLAAYGIPLTSFKAWTAAHRNLLAFA
ncbi:NmrA/HSCARG family protein [Streptosporangium sp. NBC_01639]|uniref:NmrA/HSCARG family protein n=1 Tax=Streptosporangium sp. NBC_01639 TaxID=2975948 RepID=UPI003869A579|nr:NmrA/HSCARG family protein [Streptosporangium sp. NBC_01639]